MMALVDEILVAVAVVTIFALVVAWFCGIYFSLNAIAASVERAVNALEQENKRKEMTEEQIKTAIHSRTILAKARGAGQVKHMENRELGGSK